MSELLCRRTLLSSLVGAGLSLTALRTVEAGSSPDRDNQLQDYAKISKSLERAGEQLRGMVADFVHPGEPGVPAHLAALIALNTECNFIQAQLDQLVFLLRNP